MDNVQRVKLKLQTVPNVNNQKPHLHVNNVQQEITFHLHQHLVSLLVLPNNIQMVFNVKLALSY